MIRLTVLCVLLLCLYSCSKTPETIIEDQIGTNDVWTYELARGIPIEGGFRIIEEPSNAIRSEIMWDDTDEMLKYFYQSEVGFTGQEKIVIESSSSPGDDNFTFRNIVIELEVE